MRPTKLVMTNFMPYAQPTELDLSGIHLACLAGENGHGKSAIIDAITWALWGKARARRDDELIHLGEEQMEVRLDFLLGDQEYRVIRQRDSAGRGSSTLEFQIGRNSHWTPLTGDSIRDTQETIDRTIGMGYDLFINSALLLQGRADEFTNQPPGERKRILGEILNLSIWDLLEDRAKAKVREAEGQLTALQSKAEVVAADLDKLPDYEAHLNAAAEAVERLQGELKEADDRLSHLKDKVAEAGFQKQALADVERELTSRRQELETLKRRMAQADTSALGTYTLEVEHVRDRLALIDKPQAERDSLELEIRQLSERAASLTATNEALKADMGALREEMNLLEQAGANCPLCDSELTDEHRSEVLAKKQGEGETKAGQFRVNVAKGKDVESERQQWQEQLAGLKRLAEEVPGLRSKENDLVGKITALEGLGERVTEWQEQASALDAAITEKEQRRAQIDHELRNLQQVAMGVEELRRKRDTVADDLSRANLRVGAATQQIEHCQYLAGEKEKLEQQFQEASRAKAMYDQLRIAFGKRGIQAMIIETVLPEIEEQANELLARMTDGRMSVAFESQRETKKGDISETLDIQVSDELGVRDYGLLSGGEQFRANFAVRVALSRVLARRAGARLETLIMDEGFGSQDAGGRDRLVEAINSIQDDFGLVLVVTHIDELREAFPNRIEVVKGPAGSLISVN